MYPVHVMARIQIPPIILILILSCSRIASSQDDSSEEKSDVPIIRQINKVNDDGTYTYGYEAADGSFKIETRDVLGNIKGMFGFIDDSGDLKRVSYTANNATGQRNSIVHPPVPTTVRSSELGRRPVLILKNTVTSSVPTKGPVIQHIPRKPVKEEDETTSREFSNERPYSPVRNDSSEERIGSTREPIKPSVSNPLRKVLVSKRPVEDKEKRGKGGNSLRRQLSRGLDLRGEMSHIYSGGEGRFASGIPPHLSALMSELRPVQIVRASPPETVGYQTVDAESASQEINEIPTTTTELPYGTRRPYNSAGYISSRFRRPVPMPEDTQYLQEITPQYRQQHALPFVPRSFQGTAQAIQPIMPVNPHLPLPPPSAEYQTHPHYYDQGAVMIPPTLRDELMAIIYNYLQVRLNSLTPQNPYRYSYSSPYHSPNLFIPASPPYPYSHAGYSQPYGHPYLPLNGYYPPYANPHAVYPVSTQTPYSGPNVQFSRPEQQQRRVVPIARVQNVRATTHADDADLLQMLLTSPTRIPVISQLKYTPTTERLVGTKTGQPIRNLQILTETTESSRSGTTETTERK